MMLIEVEWVPSKLSEKIVEIHYGLVVPDETESF